MLSKQSKVLLKIKASRTARSTVQNVKKKFNKSNEGSPDSMFGETILPSSKPDREHKYKSTLAVLVAGTAMGVSHVAAISSKYGRVMTGKGTLGMGLAVGAATAGVWYNWVDAAYDGVSEEDISMMFEMANSTGFGSVDEDDSDSAKAIDLLHVLVTGKQEDSGSEKSLFDYEDDDEDDDDDDDVYGKKTSFQSETREPERSSGGFGGIRTGKPLKGVKSYGKRNSNLPDIDKEDEDDGHKEEAPGWVDLTNG